MSDYYIKLIPENPEDLPAEKDLEEAAEFLNTYKDSRWIYSGAVAEIYQYCQFIDCGGNLEKICCPKCGQELSAEWWGQSMGTAAEMDFRNLTAELPCCQEDVSLNDLDYRRPCGFAKAAVIIANPAKELEDSDLEQVSRILKMPLRVVRARI